MELLDCEIVSESDGADVGRVLDLLIERFPVPQDDIEDQEDDLPEIRNVIRIQTHFPPDDPLGPPRMEHS